MLSKYHQQYAAYPDEEIARRIKAKHHELDVIFSHIPKPPQHPGVCRVAVLGCGDRRYVALHKHMFEAVLSSPVELITFDSTIEHLQGAPGVVQHDCTQPLPGAPYDITYAHVLLKFIPTEQQGDLLMHAYDALMPGGVAIVLTDRDDVHPDSLPSYQYRTPLNRWREMLQKRGIVLHEWEVPHEGLAWAMCKE